MSLQMKESAKLVGICNPCSSCDAGSAIDHFLACGLQPGKDLNQMEVRIRSSQNAPFLE